MDNTLLFTFTRFAGLNTIDQTFRTPLSRDNQGTISNDMVNLSNLDIDNQLALTTRSGNTPVRLSGTNIHSVWSDGLTCLFVDVDTLYDLSLSYSKTSIGYVGTPRMSYAPVNDRVYLTNSTYIGYYNNLALTPIPSPDITYKLPLPAGKFIAYYKGRIYVAKGSVLYISDALCDHYDIRTGFKPFAHDITMLISVDSGIYISDGNTWFLPGTEPDAFQKIKVLDVDAIPYTSQLINGTYIEDGKPGNYAIWTSLGGICLGDSSGNVKDLTNSRYNMPVHGIGGAAVRNKNGAVHYITTLA